MCTLKGRGNTAAKQTKRREQTHSVSLCELRASGVTAVHVFGKSYSGRTVKFDFLSRAGGVHDAQGRGEIRVVRLAQSFRVTHVLEHTRHTVVITVAVSGRNHGLLCFEQRHHAAVAGQVATAHCDQQQLLLLRRRMLLVRGLC
jgi:hypothetical protein